VFFIRVELDEVIKLYSRRPILDLKVSPGYPGLRWYIVARVAVAIRVFPSSVDVNLEELVKRIESSLPPQYSLVRFGEVPIAFGYKALRLVITMPEETEGGTEELEALIRGVEGVDEVEVEVVHRI
jgi:elongation factor 1-beta